MEEDNSRLSPIVLEDLISTVIILKGANDYKMNVILILKEMTCIELSCNVTEL